MAKKLLAVFLMLVVIVAVHTHYADAASSGPKKSGKCESACEQECDGEDGNGREGAEHCKMKIVERYQNLDNGQGRAMRNSSSN
ncbi:hypothetical protein ACLB2K_010647 [Fragaria x ananassa]